MAHYINYFKLYSYFTEKEELSRSQSLRNIWRTRNLPKEFKEVVYKIVEKRYSEIGDFQVDGITLKQLYKEEDMKWMQAVFFLDWLRREPGNARSFMASGRFTNAMEIDEDLRQQIKQKLQKLQAEKGVQVKSNYVPEDNTEQDIDVETESPLVGCMTADALRNAMEETTANRQEP